MTFKSIHIPRYETAHCGDFAAGAHPDWPGLVSTGFQEHQSLLDLDSGLGRERSPTPSSTSPCLVTSCISN